MLDQKLHDTSVKFLLLAFSILLLSSCTQYSYDVTYEKCNGQTGSVSYESIQSPRFDNYKVAIPVLFVGPYGRINNVCDFSYTRNPIE